MRRMVRKFEQLAPTLDTLLKGQALRLFASQPLLVLVPIILEGLCAFAAFERSAPSVLGIRRILCWRYHIAIVATGCLSMKLQSVEITCCQL
jgi:hypothetical protein